MPCTCEVLPDQRLVKIVGLGEVGFADLRDVYGVLRDDETFRSDFASIWDFSRVEGTDLEGERVRSLARLPRLFDDDARRAVVVRTDLGFGLTRMFQIMADRETGNFAIFRSLPEALEWLGLCPPE